MKNLKHMITAIILMATATKTMATDRIVEENGFGGAFTTITGALAAAVNNDRIIIYPSVSGGSYVEIISSTKTGIQMLSAIEGTKYKITGNVVLANGWSIMGADIAGVISDNATSGIGERIINCKITPPGGLNYAISTSTTNTIMFIDNDSLVSGASGCIVMYRGRVSGCYLNQNVFGLCISINPFNSNDSTVVVGNHISFTSGSGSVGIEACPTSNTLQQYLYIANNYIENLTAGAASGFFGINVYVFKVPAGGKNSIVNNTIKLVNSYFSGILLGNNSLVAGQTVDLRNNLVIVNGVATGGSYFRASSSVIVPNFQFNYCNGTAVTAFILNGILADATNDAASNSTINADGTLITGSDAINGGDPAPMYLDLDLTTNDAGCFGGSYSLANFNVVDNGARVLFMKTPRTLFVNQTLNIKAEGVDK